MSDTVLDSSMPLNETVFTEISEVSNTKEIKSEDDTTTTDVLQSLELECRKEDGDDKTKKEENDSVKQQQQQNGSCHNINSLSLQAEQNEDCVRMNGPVEGLDVNPFSTAVDAMVVVDSCCEDVPVSDTGQCLSSCSCLSPNLDEYESGIAHSAVVGNDLTVFQSESGEVTLENNESSSAKDDVAVDGGCCCAAERQRVVGPSEKEKEECGTNHTPTSNNNEDVHVEHDEQLKMDDANVSELTEGLVPAKDSLTECCDSDCVNLIATKESCNLPVGTMTTSRGAENHVSIPEFHGIAECEQTPNCEGSLEESSSENVGVQACCEKNLDVITDESDHSSPPPSLESVNLSDSALAEDTRYVEGDDVVDESVTFESENSDRQQHDVPAVESNQQMGSDVWSACNHQEGNVGSLGPSLEDCDNNVMCSARSSENETLPPLPPPTEDCDLQTEKLAECDSTPQETEEQNFPSVHFSSDLVSGDHIADKENDEEVEVIYDVPIEEEEAEEQEEEEKQDDEKSIPGALEGPSVNMCLSSTGCQDDTRQCEVVAADGGTAEDVPVITSGDNGGDEEENYYEEIKKEHVEFQGHNCRESAMEEGQSLFKRCSLVEEVMSEVERVKQQHDQVLQELNLDIEQLIMPTTPSVSSPTDENYSLSETLPAAYPCTEVTPVGTDVREHNLSTRTLPPLPIESSSSLSSSSPEDLFSVRPSANIRNLHQTKSAPLGCQTPTQTTSPTGVKQWLSRLPSLSSFREKKARPTATPSEVISWRWSIGFPEEPIYMLYDDTYHLHEGSKYGPEDGIYEDLDTRSQRFTMPSSGTYASLSKSNFADRQSISSSECNEDNSDTESTRSAGSLSVASFKGKLLNFGRKFSRHDEKKDVKIKVAESDGKSDGKLMRLFSKRKGYDLGRIKKKNVIAEAPEEQKLTQLKMSSQCQHPILPPTPTGLTPEQIKRRYIVGTLVQNENSYVASLKRLLNDYKKPLEESSPPIISANKISVMFHRLPEILQCHTEFCISLSTCVKCWDKAESIGEVFLHAFSKTVVLDIYSDYINNFSEAMDLAKSEAKRKSAFTDFLKARQITSHDRLSFFGLMVKPVQRFPQFILILQDMLRHTPHRHHDRMQLQLALTQMETMADMLNERKRESDQAQAVKRILRHVSAKSAAKSLSEGSRFLLREDTLTQLIFNQNGQWMNSKDRKLFLLNDLLVCVSVVGHSTNENNRKSERFSFKWAVPVTEVEVQEDASPILNRMVQAMSTGQSSATTKAGTPNGPVEMEGVKSIYQDLNDLLHDFEVTSRIMALVSTLRRSYMEISVEQMQCLSQSIQQAIQKKDEEVKWIDSCCLQFSVPAKSKTGKGHRELLIYQLKSMDTKQEWLTDVRLAQLALDINNSPAWDVPEQDRRPSTKVPLFVKAMPIHSSQDPTEVKCGCYHRTMSTRLLGRRPQDYVWLCSTDGVNCHISIHTLRQMGLREVFNFDMAECRISAMESVPSFDCPSSEVSLQGDTVWLGTESRRVLVYSGADAEHFKEVGCAVMSSSVLHLKFHMNQVYVALANGTIAVFHRNHRGYWQMKDFQVITLGSDPVTCLLPVNASVYCGCGRKVWVIDSSTAKVTLNHSVQHDHMGSVYTMAHSGIGLWLNLRNTPLVCLYHAETFQHLQDINITSSVRRILNENSRPPHAPRYCCVTILAASWGLLWIGTNVGVVLSIPLPRLQGMPILGRRANVAYHAIVGPVSMILVLQPVTMLSSPQTKLDLDKRNAEHNKDNATNKNVSENNFLPINNVPSQSSHPFRPFKLVSKGDSISNLAVASKTLPRGFKSHLPNFDAENCIYGLYDNLLNVREGVEDPVSQIDDDLRHSDPDLIPSIASTLDRRVRLKSGRPRSLDLANLAGLGEMVCMSSSSEDGGSGSQSLADLPEYAHAIRAQLKECDGDEDTCSNSTNRHSTLDTVGNSGNKSHLKLPTVTRSKKNQGLSTAQLPQRSVVTLVGGRGYTDLRKPLGRKEKRNSLSSSSSYYPSDAYAIMWEMKV